MILVIAEHNNLALNAATLNAVAAAQKLGSDIHVLVAGENARAVADQAAKAAGVTKVLHADGASLADGLAENVAAQVLAVADGSIFTGRQGLQLKLVDELGGQDEAVAWLAGKGVDKELKVIEWKPAGQGGILSPLSLAGTIGALTGLDRIGPELAQKTGAERLFLDGLLSVWHPETASTSD